MPNCWDRVQDFNWLLAEPNPHWTMIANEDRVPDDLWKLVCALASEFLVP